MLSPLKKKLSSPTPLASWYVEHQDICHPSPITVAPGGPAVSMGSVYLSPDSSSDLGIGSYVHLNAGSSRLLSNLTSTTKLSSGVFSSQSTTFPTNSTISESTQQQGSRSTQQPSGSSTSDSLTLHSGTSTRWTVAIGLLRAGRVLIVRVPRLLDQRSGSDTVGIPSTRSTSSFSTRSSGENTSMPSVTSATSASTTNCEGTTVI